MKKTILIFMLISLMLCAVMGCGANKENENKPILSPTREGEYRMKSSFVTKTFDELIEGSDAAIIKIGNWLGEDESFTYFEAEVIEVTRGNFSKKIILRQYGNSFQTEYGNPLYTCGNLLFVFLDTYESSEYGEIYFCDGGEHLWVSDVASYNGDIYILPRVGAGHYKALHNYINDQALYEKLLENLKEQDDPHVGNYYEGVFLYEDIAELMK